MGEDKVKEMNMEEETQKQYFKVLENQSSQRVVHG